LQLGVNRVPALRQVAASVQVVKSAQVVAPSIRLPEQPRQVRAAQRRVVRAAAKFKAPRVAPKTSTSLQKWANRAVVGALLPVETSTVPAVSLERC
jgi:hypothetical protein